MTNPAHNDVLFEPNTKYENGFIDCLRVILMAVVKTLSSKNKISRENVADLSTGEVS
jgi:hypothetical protein